MSIGIAIAATFAGSGYALAQSGMMPDFGSPPSGEIPILFNDHHVYAKPDKLRANRVLAALVKNGTILVPLRSMFEQMGATVSFDPATQSVDVTKAGADVKVTVGKPIVTINGEDRPLDVPPEIYRGVLVVPVRVISEGLRQEVKPYNIRTTVISPGAVDTELPGSVTEPDVAANIRKMYELMAIPADSFARAVAFAMSQPDDVDINEILYRPTRQEF